MSTSEQTQIKINNQSYKVELSTNALCDAEAIAGVNLFSFDQMSMAVIRGLLFAAVRGQNGVKTIEQAGDLIDLDRNQVLEAVTEAYTEYWQNQAG